MLTALTAIAAALLSALCCMELKRDLMMYQQNSYRPERYRRWLAASGDTTSLWRLSGLIVLFAGLSPLSRPAGAAIMGAAFAAACALRLARIRYKKPLVWTARARRIYSVSLILVASIATALTFICRRTTPAEPLMTVSLTLLGCYCGSHLLILAAGFILTPVEKAINRRYYRQAAGILRAMPGLRIIGITGSYGKTSTKHYLHRILSERYDTLITPASYNTTLGVIRTIREYLKPYNEVFIVEMGAKNRGDIREICDLVHPSMGIITAVGPQHLESFGSIEAVQATKFELADALPADGLAIVNDDFPRIADRPVGNTRCARYSCTGAVGATYRATGISYSAAGTAFTVEGPDGWALPLTTRLMGECNVSDLLAAVVAARALDVPDTSIRAAVAAIEPVEHRLSVKTTPGGITILDDAFNSNPVGSRMALEVLGQFTGGRRIVITPGMIELGSEQYERNRDLGQAIDANADIAIIVGEYNRGAILAGIADGGRIAAQNIHTAATFGDAQRLLTSFAAKGDTVLYENDLPDTFK